MSDLSIVYPYYRNPSMLEKQLWIWQNEWPIALSARCEIIIVDDGSPEPAAPLVKGNRGEIAVRVYRVLEDRPWHQHAARNLGAHVAVAPWLLLTDMDHVIPADTLAAVLARIPEVGRSTVFTFARHDAPSDKPWSSCDWVGMPVTLNDRAESKPHVNSFAMARRHYWKVGGYDEDYCGIYGTDRLFRDRLYRQSCHIDLAPLPLIRVSREVIPDASTTTLARKDGRELGARKSIARAKALRGEAHVVKTLQFPWERAL